MAAMVIGAGIMMHLLDVTHVVTTLVTEGRGFAVDLIKVVACLLAAVILLAMCFRVATSRRHRNEVSKQAAKVDEANQAYAAALTNQKRFEDEHAQKEEARLRQRYDQLNQLHELGAQEIRTEAMDYEGVACRTSFTQGYMQGKRAAENIAKEKERIKTQMEADKARIEEISDQLKELNDNKLERDRKLCDEMKARATALKREAELNVKKLQQIEQQEDELVTHALEYANPTARLRYSAVPAALRGPSDAD